MLSRAIRPAARRYAEGADISRVLRLPGWLDTVLSHDVVAYPLHVVFGRLLHYLNAPPAAVALEWIKAAAHARSASAMARVGVGLTEAKQRAGQQYLERVLNAAIIRPASDDGQDVMMRRRQVEAMARAGLRADDLDGAPSAP